ncbi:hypothetical protein KJ756_03215 [Patescibacteria group bacterium]|nr:hypothetical protein [Patescibacteria group bacterium]
MSFLISNFTELMQLQQNISKDLILLLFFIIIVSCGMGYITNHPWEGFIGGIIIIVFVITMRKWIGNEDNNRIITTAISLLGLMFIVLGFSKVNQEIDKFIEGNLTIKGNATTTGNFVVGEDSNQSIPGCIGLKTADGKWIFIHAISALEAVNQGLSWTTTDCSGDTKSTILIGQ